MDHDAPRASLQFLFTQLARLYITHAYTRFEKMGVHPGQIPMLGCLIEKDGQSQRELAHWLSVRPSTIAVTIKRMEKTGLVSRSQDPADLRITRIFICEKGREVFAAARKILDGIDQEFFADFSPEEMDEIHRLLVRARTNALQIVAPAEFERTASGE